MQTARIPSVALPKELLAMLPERLGDNELGEQIPAVNRCESRGLTFPLNQVVVGIEDVLLQKGIDKAGQRLEVFANARLDFSEGNRHECGVHGKRSALAARGPSPPE